MASLSCLVIGDNFNMVCWDSFQLLCRLLFFSFCSNVVSFSDPISYCNDPIALPRDLLEPPSTTQPNCWTTFLYIGLWATGFGVFNAWNVRPKKTLATHTWLYRVIKLGPDHPVWPVQLETGPMAGLVMLFDHNMHLTRWGCHWLGIKPARTG